MGRYLIMHCQIQKFYVRRYIFAIFGVASLLSELNCERMKSLKPAQTLKRTLNPSEKCFDISPRLQIGFSSSD